MSMKNIAPQLHISMNDDLAAQLEALAKKHNISKTAVIRMAVAKLYESTTTAIGPGEFVSTKETKPD